MTVPAVFTMTSRANGSSQWPRTGRRSGSETKGEETAYHRRRPSATVIRLTPHLWLVVLPASRPGVGRRRTANHAGRRGGTPSASDRLVVLPARGPPPRQCGGQGTGAISAQAPTVHERSVG